MAKNVAIGVDIGGTNSVIGVVDIKGKVLADGSIPTGSFDNVNTYLEALHHKIDELLANSGEPVHLTGIGIGAPNGNFYKGTIEHAANLKWKGVINFVELSRSYHNVPTYLTNDANAAAIGEMIYGGAKGMKNFVEITLGTGLGSGIVVNGELVYGHDGFAGEIGHVTVEFGGRLCGCGRKGCLETYASATGIVKTVIEMLANPGRTSILRDIASEKITSKHIYDAAVEGDALALEAFEFTGKVLGRSLADTIAHLSPEAIFLFGGLAQSGQFIFEPTTRHLNEHVMAIFRNKTKLLLSQLPGAHAAVLGSSALVWKEIASAKKNATALV